MKSYGDLFRLKLRLQQVDEELCKAQQEMYRDRACRKELARRRKIWNSLKRPRMIIGNV